MSDSDNEQPLYTCNWCEQEYTEDDMYETGYNHDPMCHECHERVHFLAHAKAMDKKRRQEAEEFYKGLE